MLRLIGIGLMAALLTGCAQGSSDRVPVQLARYTAEEQRQAADALPGAAPIIQRMIEDYGDLRAQVRAAR